MNGPRLGALSNNRWLGVAYLLQTEVRLQISIVKFKQESQQVLTAAYLDHGANIGCSLADTDQSVSTPHDTACPAYHTARDLFQTGSWRHQVPQKNQPNYEDWMLNMALLSFGWNTRYDLKRSWGYWWSQGAWSVHGSTATATMKASQQVTKREGEKKKPNER